MVRDVYLGVVDEDAVVADDVVGNVGAVADDAVGSDVAGNDAGIGDARRELEIVVFQGNALERPDADKAGEGVAVKEFSVNGSDTSKVDQSEQVFWLRTRVSSSKG